MLFRSEVLVADRAVAELRDEVPAVVVGDGRELEFGAVLAEEVEAREPLFDAVVPVRELQAAGVDFVGEQTRGVLGGRRLDALGLAVLPRPVADLSPIELEVVEAARPRRRRSCRGTGASKQGA